jgi:NTP pyrophosphatase (non-canonical NTP hydrolase)
MKNLSELQAEASQLLGDELKHPRVGATLGLVEELGELVQEIMSIEIYGSGPGGAKWETQRTAVEDEVGDILFSLFEVCTAYGIELEEAYAAKLAKINAKRGEWLDTVAASLQERRRKLD